MARSNRDQPVCGHTSPHLGSTAHAAPGVSPWPSGTDSIKRMLAFVFLGFKWACRKHIDVEHPLDIRRLPRYLHQPDFILQPIWVVSGVDGLQSLRHA